MAEKTISKISIKGVVIGGIVDIAASLVFGLLFAIYAMSQAISSHPHGPQTTIEVGRTAIHGNLLMYVLALLVGLACSVFGGYVAAWIAKHDELLNSTLSSFLCVAFGLYRVVWGEESSPLWVTVLMFILSPVFALIGGALMRRKRQGRSLPVT